MRTVYKAGWGHSVEVRTLVKQTKCYHVFSARSEGRGEYTQKEAISDLFPIFETLDEAKIFVLCRAAVERDRARARLEALEKICIDGPEVIDRSVS
jgi:hypothetical protein